MNNVIKTISLLVISNLFMTLAWYGHLKFKSKPLLVAILPVGGLLCSNICSKSLQIASARNGSA